MLELGQKVTVRGYVTGIRASDCPADRKPRYTVTLFNDTVVDGLEEWELTVVDNPSKKLADERMASLVNRLDQGLKIDNAKPHEAQTVEAFDKAARTGLFEQVYKAADALERFRKEADRILGK